GKYGANGFAIAGEKTSYPNYARVTFDQSTATWVPSTAEPRALQKFMASDRIAAAWYSFGTLDADLEMIDDKTHQVALYFLDWDGKGIRVQTIEILDAERNSVLD